MIKTKLISVPKKNNGSTTIIKNVSSSSSSGVAPSINPVYLWGNYFDGTSNVNGSMTINGNIITEGDIRTNTLYAKTLDVEGGLTFDDLNVNTLSANTVNTNAINASTAVFNDVSGTSIDAEEISADTANVNNKLTTNQLQAVSGYIKTLLSDEITVDYLTVTKAAHFFKLIIDEIKASQGQILITPANAVIDKVETVNGNYRCYFRAKDEDKEIYNNFEANDQIVCQTFNAASGTSYDVTNTFYWRLCVGTGTTTTSINGETVDCHYIDLSDTDKDQNSISVPNQGDNVVLLGNRTDTTRQAAIIISAYNSEFLDKGIKAPSIVQYFGINDYNLSAHRRNVISRDFNEFNGSFKTSTGDDIEELIEDVTSGITAYLHTAWANSADGSVDFTKDAGGGSYSYIGFCSNNTESDASLIYSDYTWNYCKGADGKDGKDGTDGITPNIYNLAASTNLISRNKNNVNNPSGFTISLFKNDEDGVSDLTKMPEGMRLSWNLVGQASNYAIVSPNETMPYSTNWTSANSVQYKLWKKVGNNFDFTKDLVLGVETIVIAKDGADGTNGKDGKDGASGYTPYIVNDYWYINGHNTGVKALGEDGLNGKDGVDGASGTSSYFHIAYANKNASGAIIDFSLSDPTDREYIGTYVDTTKDDSTTPSKYTWQLVKGAQGERGEQGISGTSGEDGKTSYLHIKYSNDGGRSFTSNGGETPGTYIGQYVDFNATDSTNVTAYTWALIKGADGQDGKDGKDGVDGASGNSVTGVTEYYLISSLSANVTTATTGWQTSFIAPTESKKYLWNYEETHFSDQSSKKTVPVIIGNYAKDGTDGTNGTNGKDGKDGKDGASGRGISNITEYYKVYSANTGVSNTDTNWSTAIPTMSPTNKYLWNYELISYSDSTTAKTNAIVIGVYGDKGEKGEQGDKGDKGDKGDSGTSVTITSTSITYAVTTAATQPADSKFTYTSIPTDIALGSYLWTKTVVNYSNSTSTKSYSVSRIGADGQNGTNGTNGTNGKDSYLHLAYSTSSDGSENFSTTYFNGALYIGTCVNETATDPTSYNSYDWARLKGEQGASGTSITIVSTSITYAVTTSSVQPEDSKFTYTSIPSGIAQGTFLWTKTVINYSDGNSTKTYTVTYLGTDGTNGTNGTNGKDAEFYRLIPTVEKAIVDKNSTLGVQFQYQIVHISGSTSTLVTATSSGYKVRFNPNHNSSWYSLSTGTTSPSYSNTSFITNYHKQTSKPIYFTVQLVSGTSSTVIETRVVNVTFDAAATLEITDSIETRVQGAEDNIDVLDGTVTSHTNSIATLTQNYNSISSTVNSHTTSITNLNNELDDTENELSTVSGQVVTNTSNISNLQQTATGLTSTVNSHTTSINTLNNKVTTNTNNISQLQQTADGLTSTVSSHTTSINTLDGKVTTNTNNISQIQQTSSQISSRVETIENNYITDVDFAKTVTIDATSLDASKCYPVLIVFNTDSSGGMYNGSDVIRCKVNRTLARSLGVPSYSNHADGFVCSLDWTTKASAWGTNNVSQNWYSGDTTRYISDYKINWAKETNIVGSIGQCIQQSTEIVYVRGGSMYYVSTSHKYSTITLYSNGFSWTNGTESDSRPVINATDLVIPVQDARSYSEIIQTADNIQLNVYNELRQKTGIDVSNGTITLDADTTTINGNLDLKDATDGITIYENVNGTQVPRINLQKDYISDVTTITTSDITREYNPTNDYSFTASNNKYETSLRINTIALGADEVLDIDYTDLICKLKTSSTGSTMTSGYPTRAQITYYLTRNGVTYTLDSIYANYYESTTNPYHYISESSVRFAAPSVGSYVLYMKFTMYSGSSVYPINSSYPYVTGNYKIRTSKGRDIQTYIGKDGMYAHAGGNKIFYAGQDELRLQYGLSGIRWINDNTSDVFNGSNSANKIMQVAAGTKISTNGYTVNWLPFYNYTPVFEPTFATETFTINGESFTGLLYRINPQKDNGICIASNSTSAGSDHYIMLPTTYTQNGNTYDLPEGYTVKIVKCGYGRSIDQSTGNFPLGIFTSDDSLILDTNGDVHSIANMNALNNNFSQFVKIGPRSISGQSKKITWLGLQDHN